MGLLLVNEEMCGKILNILVFPLLNDNQRLIKLVITCLVPNQLEAPVIEGRVGLHKTAVNTQHEFV